MKLMLNIHVHGARYQVMKGKYIKKGISSQINIYLNLL